MDTTNDVEYIPGPVLDQDEFLSDELLLLLGKAVHRIARLEQFINDWTYLLVKAAGKQPDRGSKPQVVAELKKALKNAPEEYRQFDVEDFTDQVQSFLEFRHFLAHGRAIRDKLGDLCLQKMRPVSKVRDDPNDVLLESLVISPEALQAIITRATELDLFVAQQRDLFRDKNERAVAWLAHPRDGRIMRATEIVKGIVVDG